MNVYFGGNFLGLKADGSLPPPGGFGSREGINAALGVVQVGDGTARGMNVISGSPGGRGVSLYDAPAGSSFSIRGNLIGTAPDGITARPNFSGGIGVQGAVPGVVIGGNTLDQANVIGGNLGNGLLIDCLDAMSACFGTSLSVTGNFIGVGIGGQALGNSGDGIQVDRLPVGRITLGGPTVSQANVIGNNANNGINAALNIPQLADPRGNVAMLINRTFNNGQLGIDIFNDERTANDAGDIDGVQNFPTFATYALAPDGASASFTFSIDTPSAGGNYPMRVDFYRGDTDEVGSWHHLQRQPDVPGGRRAHRQRQRHRDRDRRQRQELGTELLRDHDVHRLGQSGSV
jgi:hypothetical protein